MPAGIPVQSRLSADELSALDSYRRKKPNPPTRARALRELAGIALRELSNSIASNERDVACSAAQQNVEAA